MTVQDVEALQSKRATTVADQDVAPAVANNKDAKQASHDGRRPGSAKRQGATAVAGALSPADNLPDDNLPACGSCGLGRAQRQQAVDLAGTRASAKGQESSEATAVAEPRH